ncbi:nitroreductase [Paenibacillus sp. MMS20-IR301]|uniref:nitroreductase family protein n=1 Tax=Paenibacillus sp. MMS20-IR301 TaxID=2895946 RepID=UPI0028EBCA94|nr:nitroreductase [Paenibacillus sp. MMS20-IR301]WNS44363.1 nitroreductase [Paenibacillus sp. MMS20-IR301]
MKLNHTGDTNTDLVSVIRERRTIRDFNGQPLEREVLLDILENAVWAPFHGRREPWRFILFTAGGRARFADAVMDTYSPELADKWSRWARKQYCELIQAHLLVVIEADPRQKYWEDAFSAASALIQNIQLLAWEKHVGTVWKTNEWNLDPAFYMKAGIQSHERIVGTLHLGYFDKTPKPKARTPVKDLLTEFTE